MKSDSDIHLPVMTAELLEFLAPQGGIFVDCTVGLGGHSAAILAAHPENRVLGLDRDAAALAHCAKRLAPFGDRVTLRQASYIHMREIATELHWQAVDGIIMDLGLSSLQIDNSVRGFSYRQDGPLDMRFDQGSSLTASMILNDWTEGELTRLFKEYGEEPHARRVAQAVVRRRAERPWERTVEFATMLEATAGHQKGRHTPVAARCFQALRLAVNGELEAVREGLVAAEALLKPGGRLVVFAFHSLEDRLVKDHIRQAASTCVCPPRMPICQCGKQATLLPLTRKPLRAGDDELKKNPRAASAKMRAARKPDGTERKYNKYQDSGPDDE